MRELLERTGRARHPERSAAESRDPAAEESR
jgi:hypothetical protein